MIKTRNSGFTLVELLVVIAIIAVLATATSVMAPKMLKKGAQAKSVGNMRQMIATLQSYATDHSNRLPPPATKDTESEAKKETYWFTYCQQQIGGDDLEKYLADDWWKANQSIFANPMVPKKMLKASSVGYGMNGALARNVALSRDEEMEIEDSKYTAVSLATIREPEKTPVIMPHWSWSYLCDPREAADEKQFKPFLAGERLPVLFLDGHVVEMSPKEYVRRELHRVPKKQD